MGLAGVPVLQQQRRSSAHRCRALLLRLMRGHACEAHLFSIFFFPFSFLHSAPFSLVTYVCAPPARLAPNPPLLSPSCRFSRCACGAPASPPPLSPPPPLPCFPHLLPCRTPSLFPLPLPLSSLPPLSPLPLFQVPPLFLPLPSPHPSSLSPTSAVSIMQFVLRIACCVLRNACCVLLDACCV